MTKLVKLNTIVAKVAGTTIAATDTAVDIAKLKDSRIVFELVNSDTGAINLTICGKVNGIHGAFGVADLVLSCPAGTSYVCLDLAKYKVLSGANKGKVYMKAATASKIVVNPIGLPNA